MGGGTEYSFDCTLGDETVPICADTLKKLKEEIIEDLEPPVEFQVKLKDGTREITLKNEKSFANMMKRKPTDTTHEIIVVVAEAEEPDTTTTATVPRPSDQPPSCSDIPPEGMTKWTIEVLDPWIAGH